MRELYGLGVLQLRFRRDMRVRRSFSAGAYMYAPLRMAGARRGSRALTLPRHFRLAISPSCPGFIYKR